MPHNRKQNDCHERKRSRRSVLTVLGATGATALSGCLGGESGGGGSSGDSSGDSSGGSSGGSTEAQGTTAGSSESQNPTLTWAGSNAGVDGLLARVANDTSFDKDNGINLEVNYLSASSLEVAIGQGKVDAGNMSVSVAARFNNNSSEKKLQCMRPLYKIHEQIVLHPNITADVADDIEGGLGDLRDYTIGSLGEGSSVYNIFELLVTQYGYDINDYDLRFLDPAAMVQQMIQGNLDAILSFDPPSSKLIARDEGYEILFEYSQLWKDATGHQLPIGEVTSYRSKLEENPGKYKAMDQMWNDVGTYIKENTDQVLRNYRDHLGLENEAQIKVAQERMRDLFYDSWNEDARMGSRALVEQSIEAGTIEGADMDTLFTKPSDL